MKQPMDAYGLDLMTTTRMAARDRVWRGVVAGALMLGAARMLAGQEPAARDSKRDSRRDSTRCDSVVSASRVDSVDVGLFISAFRSDGGELPDGKGQIIATVIGGGFVPPRPFRLTVFSGPARMRLLRLLSSDTAAALRAPTLTGIYRFTATKQGVTRVGTVRASLMPGFDSAATTAIHEAGYIGGILSSSEDEDSMRVDIRFSTDSTVGSRRLVTGFFPRLRVVDAVPQRDNPSAVFPEEAKRDSITMGEVLLRFVVDRSGEPAMETVEVIRATGLSFLRSALNALQHQHFVPATVGGCAVAQLIEYPFSFVAPEPPGLRDEQ